MLTCTLVRIPHDDTPPSRPVDLDTTTSTYTRDATRAVHHLSPLRLYHTADVRAPRGAVAIVALTVVVVVV